MRKPLLILTLSLTAITAQAADKTDIAQRHATAEQAFQQGDIRTAIRQWEILAQAGDAEAQGLLGWFYYHGQGVPQDYEKSRNWLEKSAAQGNTLAQIHLAVFYLQGIGGPQNKPQARALLERAVTHDTGLPQSIQAMVMLGALYADDGDYTTAAIWLEKAAQRGDATAQYEIGRLYADGKGVPQDYTKAITWYQKAAA